jgi:hypothetical protein
MSLVRGFVVARQCCGVTHDVPDEGFLLPKFLGVCKFSAG